MNSKNLFELADDTVALVDYESEYKKENQGKYLNYLAGVVNRYLAEKGECPMLRMIVIYTGDIKREEARGSYDLGAVRLTVESAFLSEFNGDEALNRLRAKVEEGVLLTDREQMELIILPLSYRKRTEKEQKIQEAVELALRIRDREQQIFVVAGMLVFADKIIDDKTSERIRRAIEMTKVEKLFEKEKEEALRRQAEAFEKERKEMREQTAALKKEKRKALREQASMIEDDKRAMAMEMIRDRELSFEKIAKYSGLDIEVVGELAAGDS